MKQLSRLVASSFLALTLLSSLPLAAYASPFLGVTPALAAAAEPAKQTTLKLVTFLPSVLPKVKIQLQMIDKINDRAKGELVIKYIGGPDVIKPFELANAVKTGVVDIGILPGGFFPGLVAAANVTQYSQLTVAEERKRGVWDYMRPLYEKGGLYILGRANPVEAGWGYYNLFTNKKTEKVADFRGQKIAAETIALNYFTSVGATVVTISDAELFTAMQQGVVDGFLNPIDQIFRPGFHRVTKYVIDHSFNSPNQVIIIGLKKWNSLPKRHQDLIKQVQLEMEPIWPKQNTDLLRAERQKLQKAGRMFVTFPPG